MNDQRFRDLCTEYLLGDLAGEELAELERELESGGEPRRAELERLREVLGSLALSADPVRPPESLGEKVLERIREEGSSGGASVTPLPSHRAPREGRPWRWIAAAAVLLLAAGALSVWNLRLQGDLTARRAALDSARERIAALDSANRALARAEGDLRTLASPDARTVALAGTEAHPSARARVFVDPLTGRALLFAYELPILAPDSVYQLWAIRGDQPTSAGVFTASGEGPARLEVEEPGLLQGADALAVTVEPAPGQPAPTGEMVLIGSS